MRVKTIFRMGMRNLFAHTFRLLIVVVLATVALGLLGTAVSASRFDAASARLESVYTFDERYVVQGKLYPLSQDDLSLLTDTGRPFSLCASNGGIAPTFTAFLDPESTAYGTTGALYDAPYYVIAADEAALQEAGITVIGRLPAQRNEVALSMCQFRLFLENGYYDNIASPIRIDYETGTLVYDPGYVYPVTDAASFIREARRITLRDYAASDEAAGEYAELEATIVGIVDYGECPYEHAMNGASVSHGIDYYDAIYVSEEYLTEYTGGYGQYALFEKGASFSADEAFLQAIEAGEAFALESETLRSFDESAGQLSSMQSVFGYIGIGLTVFCAVLIYQFISFSLESKKGEIGILRALGAGKKDVAFIFLTESLLLALLQALLGSLLTIALIPSVNAIVRGNLAVSIVFVQFSVLPFVIVFAVSIVVSLLSAFIPIYRTAKQPPVVAIRRHEV